MISFRASTRDDIAKLHGEVPLTTRSVTVEKQGKPVGVGGIYYQDGKAIAFSAIDDSLTPREIVKAARWVMGIIRSVRGPVLAVQGDIGTSETTLRHFGFEPIGSGFWRISDG